MNAPTGPAWIGRLKEEWLAWELRGAPVPGWLKGTGATVGTLVAVLLLRRLWRRRG